MKMRITMMIKTNSRRVMTTMIITMRKTKMIMLF